MFTIQASIPFDNIPFRTEKEPLSRKGPLDRDFPLFEIFASVAVGGFQMRLSVKMERVSSISDYVPGRGWAKWTVTESSMGIACVESVDVRSRRLVVMFLRH